MATIAFNNLSKADGSALIDQDGTIVQATVFGPVDVAQSRMNYEEAVVEIWFKPKINIHPNSAAFDDIREIENLLKSVFQEIILTRLHPRTLISVLVQEIYNNGNLLSSSVNAVCCALIDAGLPMKCPVAGISLELEEVKSCKFDFVFDSKQNLITILTRGCVDEENLKKAILVGQERAKQSFAQLRDRVGDRFIC